MIITVELLFQRENFPASSYQFSCLGYYRRILEVSVDELRHRFDTELPNIANQPSNYARNLLEFCSYKALHRITEQPDYLSDKNFRILMYDMMLAWEVPGVENPSLDSVRPHLHSFLMAMHISGMCYCYMSIQ